MRTKLGIAAALALSAIAVPTAVQAQDYYGYGGYDQGRGYDYGRGYDHDRYDRHEWREHQRWEREREREARRDHRRWEREHRYYDDYGWNR